MFAENILPGRVMLTYPFHRADVDPPSRGCGASPPASQSGTVGSRRVISVELGSRGRSRSDRA